MKTITEATAELQALRISGQSEGVEIEIANGKAPNGKACRLVLAIYASGGAIHARAYAEDGKYQAMTAEQAAKVFGMIK